MVSVLYHYGASFNSIQVAPYLTLLLNGTGWAPGYPRLMTNEQLEIALTRAEELGGARFQNIGDISCDPLVMHRILSDDSPLTYLRAAFNS